MKLPGHSEDHWAEWAGSNPTKDYILGTLSSESTDKDVVQNPLVSRITEGDVDCILCTLDPDLFKDSIPREQGGRSVWTTTQRDKAIGCKALSTIDGLSDWVGG